MGKDSKFGDAFKGLLKDRGMTQTQAASSLDVSKAYLSAVSSGSKGVTPARIDTMSEVLSFSADEKVRLHRAAAVDAGFNLDLPDDF